VKFPVEPVDESRPRVVISTYQLKSRFQSLLRPLAARLTRMGITANQITLAACAVSLAIGALVSWGILHNHMILLIFFWSPVRMAANALDGMLAREFAQASRLGAVLNEICDVLSDVALYLPFALIAGSSAWLVIAVVLLAVISEFAGLLPAALGGERAYEGPMGKSDRALVFSVAALLIGCGMPVNAHLDALWLAMIALLLLTIINRCRAAVHGKRAR
jgi:CDP-diacylglycerol--glycerol-3-phosphate 3-phosphatidyltransferase